MRFSDEDYKIEVENEIEFNEFIFHSENFLQLSRESGIKSIFEGNQHLVFIPGLCLIEYMPDIFSDIRKTLSLSDFDFIQSFNIQENLSKLQSINETWSKKAIIKKFITHDKKFIIKKITKKEKDFIIISLLKNYRERIENQSCLAGIIGVFGLTHANVDFLVMENPIDHYDDALIFKIKSPIENRHDYDLLHNQTPQYGIKLKDSNLIESRYRLNLSTIQSQKLFLMISNDLEYLSNLKATDYSILVCFYKPGSQVKSRYVIEGINEIYAISIIGYWKNFSIIQRFARAIRNLVKHNNEAFDRHPEIYKLRLFKFFSRLINDFES